MTKAAARGRWQRWHFFAIAAAAVAVIGGVWGVIAAGGPETPTPSPTPSSGVLETPAP